MRTRASVHVSLDAALASRLRAFAGFHGRAVSDVVAEGVRHAIRGFSARQDPRPAAAELETPAPVPPTLHAHAGEGAAA
jgi:hypothetical protein